MIATTSPHKPEHFWFVGRIVSADPGKIPDELHVCPVCSGPVLKTHRSSHLSWHEQLEKRIADLKP